MSKTEEDVLVIDGKEYPIPTAENTTLAEADECVSLDREIRLLFDVLDCQVMFFSDQSSFLDLQSEEEVLEEFSRYFGKPLAGLIDVTQPVWQVAAALKQEFPNWPKDQEWIDFMLRNSDMELADAQVELGVRYANGEGIVQDFDKAAYWYQQAALQGDARAMTNLGKLYASGAGVTQDWGKATGWFRKAAEKGDSLAQFYLAASYAEGMGVEFDPRQTYYWNRQSAEQGCALGQYYLGKCYEEGFGVGQDAEQAEYWYDKAAEQGVDHESEAGY